MDSATAITNVKAALVANLAATSSDAAMTTLATAIVTAVVTMLGTAQISVTAGLAGSTGPVTGIIPAGSIT